MTWTKSGTITVTNGSRIITGTGTSWIATVSAGEGFQGPDGRVYEIESVNSDVQLTLPVTSPYLGANASGQAYTILPTQDAMRALAGQAATLVNNFGAVKDNAFVRTDIDKATPIDTDAVALRDSVTGLGRLLTWSNLKSAIKTYLSGVAFPIGQTTPAAGSFTTLSASGQISSGSTTAPGALQLLSPGAALSITPDPTSGANGVIYSASFVAGGSGPHKFQVGGVERAAVSASGLVVTGSMTAHGGGLQAWTDSSGTNGAFSIQSRTGKNLVIKDEFAGVDRVTIDASGNLGLGTAPSAWGTATLQIGISAFNTYASQSNVYNNAVTDASNNAKYIVTNFASAYRQTSGSHQWYTAPSGTAGTPITFTQAMTLDGSGNLLVRAAAAGMQSDGFSVNTNGVGGTYCNIMHPVAAGSGVAYMQLGYDSGVIGSITQSGTTAVAYNTTSDHRLKENVRPANATRFMDIEFVDFEWVDGRHDCGAIAHQLQSVYPDLVLGEKDATEVRQVEITHAAPAVTEQVLVSPAIPAVIGVEATDAVEGSPAEYETVLTDEVVLLDGVETTITHSKVVEVKAAVVARAAVEAVAAVAAVEAVYETVVVTPAVEAVTEEQEFPVYQQVNYTGLIGRMGARVQQLQRTADAQAELIASLVRRLDVLEGV